MAAEFLFEAADSRSRIQPTVFSWFHLCCNYFIFSFSYVVFSILPTIADIIIAVVYFISAFDIYFGLIVCGTMVLYFSK